MEPRNAVWCFNLVFVNRLKRPRSTSLKTILNGGIGSLTSAGRLKHYRRLLLSIIKTMALRPLVLLEQILG